MKDPLGKIIEPYDIIVCIDDRDVEHSISFGSSYSVRSLDEMAQLITIADDKGTISQYFIGRFVNGGEKFRVTIAQMAVELIRLKTPKIKPSEAIDRMRESLNAMQEIANELEKIHQKRSGNGQ